MDIVAILALIQKGLTVAAAIYEAGKNAAPAIQAISALVTGAQEGKARLLLLIFRLPQSIL